MAGKDRPLVEPASRAELREWLAANHASSPGVRLAIGKKGNTVTTLTYEQAVLEALCFGWIDGQANRIDADRYALLLTPRKPGSGWAATNKARVERLAADGLLMPAGITAIEAARADGSWSRLDDVEALVVPGDLAAALAANPAAQRGFASTSPSARKLALNRVYDAKRPETRARRIAETVQAAAEREGAKAADR